LIERWRSEAAKAGRTIERVALAYEAGRDGFWLARWLLARGIEAYVIHPTSIPVSREHKRAKTDRLDVALLRRAFLGWLRGEPKHCSMAAIATLEEEDAKRPSRERESLVGEQTRLINRMKSVLVWLGIRGFKPELRKAPGRLAGLRTPEGRPIPPHMLAELGRDLERLGVVRSQIKAIEQGRLKCLERAPDRGPPAMVRLLMRVHGLGLETADMLTHEVFYRSLRDARAVARYVGITGSPDESGAKRREKGLAKAGNARAPRHDPARLALPEVPTGQSPRAMVPSADRQRRAQDQRPRRARPQAADHAVAPGQHGRGPPGPRAAASGLMGKTGQVETSVPAALGAPMGR
jgi:transposase